MMTIRYASLMVLIGIGILLTPLFGCAVGRGPAGEIVLGVEAGRLVESTEEALNAGLGGLLGLLGLGGAGGAGVAAVISKMAMAALERRRKTADQEREAAERAAGVLAAEKAAWADARRVMSAARVGGGSMGWMPGRTPGGPGLPPPPRPGDEDMREPPPPDPRQPGEV